MPVRSAYLVADGKEVSWGMVTLQSPDERRFTVTSARAISEPEGAALQPGYALEWPRDIGAVQWTGCPPSDPEQWGTPPAPGDGAATRSEPAVRRSH